MKLNRFERKILAAIVVAAVMPLVGAMVLGRAVLVEAYQVGVNERVRAQLERGLSVYRDHFVSLRNSANQAATAVAADYLLHSAVAARDTQALNARLTELLAQYGDIASVTVEDSAHVVLGHAADAARGGSMYRQLEIERPLENGDAGARVLVVVAAPAQPFVDYQRAGELADTYRQLEKGKGQVATFYLVVYAGFLLSVIVIALAVGIVITRRVTGRVALLAAATRRLGAGELDVRVPTDVNDEIGELTRSWNDMVRDMQQARGRIEYLQRIGAWQEFARRLAHEIKNPLTPIQLAIQEVSRGYKGGDAAFEQRLADARAIIEEEVATLRRLTSEFSTFAKLPEASLAPADLNDFLRDASRSFDALREELRPDSAIEVRAETASVPLPVRIDAMMLKRALDNLIRNALQALPAKAGDTPSRVIVRTAREGRDAILEVQDNGAGVPERDRQRVFDPYFTTKSDGTGLGLPIVKKVVLEHHGEITCTETAPHGATFRVRLPLS
ncbi:MAG TPA: ATP-binding protein [Polyangiales bacterium]|jgi:nitrogen fixation/metabolism regulation signal transduction histidine kinase|nr:ATP-binding protein [Polyangiales bacterium]